MRLLVPSSFVNVLVSSPIQPIPLCYHSYVS